MGDADRRVHEEGLDHGEAGEIEHPVIDRKEDRRDGTIQPRLGIDRRLAADGDGAHRSLAEEDAAVVPLATAVSATARGEDTIDPALEDRRQSEPPQWELQNQYIAPEEPVHLRLDVRRKSVVRGSVGLFALLPVVRRIVHSHKVPAVRHRVEAHRVEVRDGNVVSRCSQRVRRLACHRAVEALRFRVGMNDEDAHSAPLIWFSILHADATDAPG